MKKRLFKILFIITILFPFNVNAANRVINGNDFATYNRTKQEIYNQWQLGKIDFSVGIFTSEASYTSPYKAAVVTDDYLQEVVDNLNYYRYLVGVPIVNDATIIDYINQYRTSSGASLIDPSTTNDEELQTAEVIQTLYVEKNRALTHHLITDFPKPADMDESFYNLGANANHNIISYGRPDEPNFYFFDESIFNVGYPENGHRMALLGPEIVKMDYGIGEYTVYGRDTTDRHSYDNMENSFAAYPSPGYFPKQDFANISDWDVFLNIDDFKFLTAEEQDNVVVTIRNLTTDEVFTRTKENNNLYFDYTCYENMCTIYNRMSILQPERSTTYYEDSYEVTVANLIDKSGSLVDLKYTVNFYDKMEGTTSTIVDAEFTISRIYYDGTYDENMIDDFTEQMDIVLYLDNGNTYNYLPASYQINYYGTAGYGTEVYHAIPVIDLPEYIIDSNNVLANKYITIQGNNIESTYKMVYDETVFNKNIGDSVTLSIEDIYYDRDGYITYGWYKEKDDEVNSLENIPLNGFDLTINNLTKEHADNYYFMLALFDRAVDMYVYVSKPLTININIPVEEIIFNSATMDMYVGATEKLYPVITPMDANSEITWSSSDSSIVSVDEEGNITANATGSATITVASGSVSASIIINVSANTKGDLNKNGTIDLPDVIKLLKIYLGVESATGDDAELGDMDSDGSLTLSDVITLLKVYLGVA